jgi:hypothetical protein
MNKHTQRLVALAAGAAALGGGTAITLVGAGTASAQAPVHTFTVVTHQLQDKIVNGVDVATDKDLQHGSATGYDVTSCRVDIATHIARCDVALARAGGLLFGHAHLNVDTGHGGGTITGGTRRFQGATGSIAVAAPRVTVTWSN